MVCSAERSGLGEMASSGSVTAVPRLRDPSVEPTLEAEWVLERTRRVIPAVGTRGRQRNGGGVSKGSDADVMRVMMGLRSQGLQPVSIRVQHTTMGKQPHELRWERKLSRWM